MGCVSLQLEHALKIDSCVSVNMEQTHLAGLGKHVCESYYSQGKKVFYVFLFFFKDRFSPI